MEQAAQQGISMLFQHGILGIVNVFLMITAYYLLKRADRKEDKFIEMSEKFNNTITTFAENEAKQTEIMKDLKDLINHNIR
jgi:hypothetical protein